MEKTRITLLLLVLCVRVDYMLGTPSNDQVGKEDRGAVSGRNRDVLSGEPVAKVSPVKPPVEPAVVEPAIDAADPDPAPPKPAHNNKGTHKDINQEDPKEGKIESNDKPSDHVDPHPAAANRPNTLRTPPVNRANLYTSLLSNCSDLKELKDFSKEPIFSVCSNWTTSDLNITQIPSTNATRALCTLYFKGFTTLCAKLKSLNTSLSQSGIKLNPLPVNISFPDAAAVCVRLNKQLKFFKDPMHCLDSCYANENLLSQCYLADYYFSYKYLPAPIQVNSSKSNSSIESPEVKPRIVMAPTIVSSSKTKEESQKPSQADNLLIGKAEVDIHQEQEVPKKPVKSPENDDTKNAGQQEENQVDDQHLVDTGADKVPAAKSDPEGEEKLPKNEEISPDQAKVGNNVELSEKAQPKTPPPPPPPAPPQQEGEEDDNQDIAFDKDKDSMDPPEEEVVEPGAPRQIDDEEKSIAKPNQLEEDMPISEDDIDGESYFFSYFMVVCVLFVLGYVFYHNRTKVMALVIEGKRNKRQYRGRRPNSANYHKLDSNLEEAISSTCTKSKSNVIY